MHATTRIGMLTPSSNTVVEPVTAQILSDYPDISAHFSRLPVTEISLEEAALAQFSLAPFLSAAQLLADARMAVIAWNGTSSAWMGFAQDATLVAEIESRFHCRSTSSMLAINAALQHIGAKRIALATPYTAPVQARIVAQYQALDYEISDEIHLNEQVNFAFAALSDTVIADMLRQTARHRPDVIVSICTNMAAAPLVASLEAELNIPIFDSLSAVVWQSLKLANIPTEQITGWGRLFQL